MSADENKKRKIDEQSTNSERIKDEDLTPLSTLVEGSQQLGHGSRCKIEQPYKGQE